jgi:hypothetical protein
MRVIASLVAVEAFIAATWALAQVPSRVDRGGLEHLGSRLVRLPDPLRASYGRLIARIDPGFFTERFRKGLPTSIDELEWRSPILIGLDEFGLAPNATAHSIIADRRDPPGAGGSDGLVPYESAHLEGVASESLVSSRHLCQEHPAVIREVRRILEEHPTRSGRPPTGPSGLPRRASCRAQSADPLRVGGSRRVPGLCQR